VTPPPAPARASTFGASLRFKGDLVADEDLVVEGQVEGSILHTRCLTIATSGSMRGDIRARRIVVEGTVDGNLYALESVVLRPGSTVRGDVFAPRVAIEEGARLSGRIDMDKAPSVPKVATRPGGPAETPRELSTQEVTEILARP
jgi:cytoskeletal protein CcmA (bactofilin family)